MHQEENIISKAIVTADGEKNFSVRYIRGESVGIVTTETDKSYFILDSADYWYDLTQEKYPPIMKCSCKNDRFNLTFDYTPRVGTEDFKEINITCRCTVCGKAKKLPTVEIDYSPSSHLLDNPLTFCEKPKIKYKTYSARGYWSKEELLGIAEYLLKNNMLAYCWYWDPQITKRYFKELSADELHDFLTGNSTLYIALYFSEEPLDNVAIKDSFDGKGASIPHDIWRKNRLFMLHGPCTVASYGAFYHIDFCSEYLDKNGNIVKKPESFSRLAEDFKKYTTKLSKESIYDMI